MNKYKCDNFFFFKCIKCELLEFILYLKIYKKKNLFDICEINKKYNNF